MSSCSARASTGTAYEGFDMGFIKSITGVTLTSGSGSPPPLIYPVTKLLVQSPVVELNIIFPEPFLGLSSARFNDV